MADLMPVEITVAVWARKLSQFSSRGWPRMSNRSFRTDRRRGRVATITHLSKMSASKTLRLLHGGTITYLVIHQRDVGCVSRHCLNRILELESDDLFYLLSVMSKRM